MTLGVLTGLLGRMCGELVWISQTNVCQDLRAKLAQSTQAQGRNDRDLAARTLRAFLDQIEAQHGAEKPMNDNAYWLLRVNAEYLLAHM